MSAVQPFPCSRCWRRRSSALALVAITAALSSCTGNAEGSTGIQPRALEPRDRTPAGRCLWETSELLSRVDAQAPDLADCGLLLGQQPLDSECFTDGLAAKQAVQITINNCIDCMIHSTYLSTPNAAKFHLYREADYYGDAVRVVRVESCSDFVAGEGAGANCAEPAVLYSCSDPLPGP